MAQTAVQSTGSDGGAVGKLDVHVKGDVVITDSRNSGLFSEELLDIHWVVSKLFDHLTR